MAESTRERIREVALDLFAEHGFSGTSTRDICSRAGVNGAALNYHWRSKEQLWQAVCESCGAWFGKIVANVDLSAAPAETIAKFLRLVFDGLAEDPRPIRIVMWAAMQPHEKDHDGVVKNFRPLVDFASMYLRTQRTHGVVAKEVDIEVVALLLHSMVSYTVINRRGVVSLFGKDLRDPAVGHRVREAIVSSALLLLGLADEPQTRANEERSEKQPENDVALPASSADVIAPAPGVIPSASNQVERAAGSLAQTEMLGAESDVQGGGRVPPKAVRGASPKRRKK